MNNICASCGGKCCQGIIEVYSQDEIYYDKTLVWEDPSCQFDRMMQMVNMQCIALKKGKCSIHDKRPQVCREFEVGCQRCVNYRTGKLNAHLDSICSLGDALAKATKL